MAVSKSNQQYHYYANMYNQHWFVFQLIYYCPHDPDFLTFSEFDPGFELQFTPAISITLAAIYSTLAVTALAMNIFIVVVIFKNELHRKVRYFFVFALSLEHTDRFCVIFALGEKIRVVVCYDARSRSSGSFKLLLATSAGLQCLLIWYLSFHWWLRASWQEK